ncbi:MAG: 50S ribosomal protein L3 [Parcubacteria group bacterium]|nr:50S ribosomal protein L3 [Parcubacteria group bacterium]
MPKAKQKFILAQKLGMTQIFDEEGNVHRVTLLRAGPIFITQVKTKEKDGYQSVQVGFGKKKRISKPREGHIGELGSLRWLREFRLEGKLPDTSPYEKNQKIDVSVFEKGEKVNVSSLSKGRGFQGVVKRHGFHGGPRTHGQKHHLRAPGSIGSTDMQRVAKGRRMAGHMGVERVTIKNLKIAEVLPEENLLALEGAVPGTRGTLVEVYK